METIKDSRVNLESNSHKRICEIRVFGFFDLSDFLQKFENHGKVGFGTVPVAQKHGKKANYFAEIDDDELKVKFDRGEVQAIVSVGEQLITVWGRLVDGTEFEGTDTIKVIDKGKEHDEDGGKKRDD